MIHWRSGNVAHLKIYNGSSPVRIEPDEMSWILTFQISIWIRIPFRHTDSRVESQSTVTNYMQMTALGERDVRNIIVGAETERLSKIIAVEVKAIIISRRCYFSCSSGGFCSADVCECRPLHLLPLAPSLSEFPVVCFSASVWGAVWRVRRLFFCLFLHTEQTVHLLTSEKCWVWAFFFLPCQLYRLQMGSPKNKTINLFYLFF